MKTLIKKIRKETGKKVPDFSKALLVVMITVSSTALAQDLKNLKNSLSSIKIEQAREAREQEERIAFEEKMSYVYMALGLSLVISIAWFTTVYARKNKKVVEQPNHQQTIIRHSHTVHRRHPRDRARVRR